MNGKVKNKVYLLNKIDLDMYENNNFIYRKGYENLEDAINQLKEWGYNYESKSYIISQELSDMSPYIQNSGVNYLKHEDNNKDMFEILVLEL